MDVSKELFDEFIQWLKLDGLTPRKSERLWKKTIFLRLINGHKTTQENWEDFMLDYVSSEAKKCKPKNINFDENCLIGIGVNVSGLHKTIRNVVKGDTMSRIFFEDTTDCDVENTIIFKILDAYMKDQK